MNGQALKTRREARGDQNLPFSGFAALHILIQLYARRPLALMPSGLLGGAAPWRGARDR